MRSNVLMTGSVLLVKAPLRDIPYQVIGVWRRDLNRTSGPCEVHTVSETGYVGKSLLT